MISNDYIVKLVSLYKLNAYGFGDVVIDWIRAFLINRKQRVVIGSSASDWKEVVSGVPQGSVLGPLLFLIFINDMPGLVHHFCKLFADDTKLIAIFKNSSDKILLQKDIDALVNWSNIWKISFNEEKGKAMFIGGKKFDTLNSAFIWPEDSSDPNLDTDPHDRQCRFKMNDSILGETIAERDLGIMVDNKLNRQNQLNHDSQGVCCLRKFETLICLLDTIHFDICPPSS